MKNRIADVTALDNDYQSGSVTRPSIGQLHEVNKLFFFNCDGLIHPKFRYFWSILNLDVRRLNGSECWDIYSGLLILNFPASARWFFCSNYVCGCPFVQEITITRGCFWWGLIHERNVQKTSSDNNFEVILVHRFNLGPSQGGRSSEIENGRSTESSHHMLKKRRRILLPHCPNYDPSDVQDEEGKSN